MLHQDQFTSVASEDGNKPLSSWMSRNTVTQTCFFLCISCLAKRETPRPTNRTPLSVYREVTRSSSGPVLAVYLNSSVQTGPVLSTPTVVCRQALYCPYLNSSVRTGPEQQCADRPCTVCTPTAVCRQALYCLHQEQCACKH